MMMKEMSIDLETYSDINITKCGAYKYAESDEFEILLFGVSVDGGPVKVYDLARADMPTVVAEAFRYDRLILAAASYDGGVFPCMEDFLHHLRAKTYRNRKVALLENGTWAPSAARTMRGVLDEMKNLTICEPVVTIRSTMKEADKEAMKALADAILA